MTKRGKRGNLNKAKESLVRVSRDEIRSLIGAPRKTMEYVETFTQSELPPGSPKIEMVERDRPGKSQRLEKKNFALSQLAAQALAVGPPTF